MKKLFFAWAAVAVLLPAAAHAQVTPPVFSAVLAPDTIGPGSVTSVTYTIANDAMGATPASNVAFDLMLPMGVTLASPSRATTTCANARLVAINGGTTVGLSSARLGSGVTCTVSFDISGLAVGAYLITTGNLTSSAGDSGTASVTLTVDANRPGFAKQFAPNQIVPGSVATLTFTIDNTANPGVAQRPAFTDQLPPGMIVANPSNATTDCRFATINAPPGGSQINFNGFDVAPGASCTVNVDVTTLGAGVFGNTTADLTTGFGATICGRAAAVLDAAFREVQLDFVNDPTPPGGTARLQVILSNFNRASAATNVALTMDLGAALMGLAAVGLPMNDACGMGSQLSGTSVVTLTSGQIPASGACTFFVDVLVPAGAAMGGYQVDAQVTADVGGQMVTLGSGSDQLRVAAAASLAIDFLDDPVATGEDTRLEFVITNQSATSDATNIAFTGDFSTFVPSVVATPPANGFCGMGSTMAVTPPSPFNATTINMVGGTLAAGASCTFEVVLSIPTDTPGGQHTATIGSTSAVIGGATVASAPAADILAIVAAPVLTKRFTNDPVAPGGTVTVEYTLSHGAEAEDATNVSFADDLDAALTGLAPMGLPLVDVCGPGSRVAGTSSVTLTGGSVAAGTDCTFSVQLAVPMSAVPGTHPSTTGNVTATSLGLDVTGLPATDVLDVQGFDFTKRFVGNPALAGTTVPLEFTLTNQHTEGATAVSFLDDLRQMHPQMRVAGTVPPDVCGVGSQVFVSATSVQLNGGSLASGASCSFQVDVTLPANITLGDYVNSTTPASVTYGMTTVTTAPAVDVLTVVDPLTITKTFIGDPVLPGGTVQLEFTITNNDQTQTVNTVAFTDDLAAVVPMTAVGLPLMDVCGAGSALDGTDTLTLAGGTLAPGASCTFAVDVQIPMEVPAATAITNVTSDVTGTIGMTTVTGPPATDTLMVDLLAFTKSFTSSTTPGGTTSVVYRIEDRGASEGVGTLTFSDDLTAALPGLTATALPATAVCGPRSIVDGTTSVTLSGGAVDRASVCSFEVMLQVPMTAQPGAYPSTTSTLTTAANVPVARPATADLVVVAAPAPGFAKVFAPATITEGDISTLTFTIDNGASTADARDVRMTDNLPAGLVVGEPVAASSSCGGTVMGMPGDTVVSFAGDAIAAGDSCTISINVTSGTEGTYVNTTEPLMTSLGVSPPATAMLTVDAMVVPPRDGGVDMPPTRDGGKAPVTPPGDANDGCSCDAARGDAPASGFGWLLLGLLALRGAGRRPRGSRVS